MTVNKLAPTGQGPRGVRRGALTVLAAAALATSGAVAVQPSALAATGAAASDPCTLRPSSSKNASDEARSCFSVALKLSRAVAVGGRARLDVTVDSAVDATGVALEVELPPTLRWVSAPAGTTIAARTSKAPHKAGRLQVAKGSVTVEAGGKITLSGTVEAVKAGSAEISARVDGGGQRRQAADFAFLTIGATQAQSRFGITTKAVSGAVAYAGPAVTPMVRLQARKQSSTPTVTKVTPASASGRACVKGTWNYLDAAGTGRPAISWRVEAWDADNGASPDDLLASSLTGWNGDYNLCFANGDENGTAQDVYVKFIARNNNWRVTRFDDSDYAYATGTVNNIADGATNDFGWLRPGPDNEQRVGSAFGAVQTLWNNTPGTCWDMIGSCRSVVVHWTPDSTDGTYYSPSKNDVHLAAADPDAPITVAHEASHAVMDDVYDDNMPSSPNCNPHSITGSTSTGCAWVEGFAEWLPATVFNDPNFRWPSGNFRNLETPTWGSAGWANGDTVEGRVAGAMIDITDSTNEGYDKTSEGMSKLWDTFQRHNSTTFNVFWKDRKADGYDVSNTVLGALYQSTIDYGFVH